ncbi:MAG TPA: DUF664 domain-containing protein [Jiangellaceae bacterium]|nr:DUF664 domain-containing protein [Jiangellaceae bacterium]
MEARGPGRHVGAAADEPVGDQPAGSGQAPGIRRVRWFCETFGRESDTVPFDSGDPDADMRAEPHETTADIAEYYGRARAAADQVIDEVDVDDVGTAWFGDTVSMRWVLIHMIEDTARHAGHMDILRELIDGQTGDHPPD